MLRRNLPVKRSVRSAFSPSPAVALAFARDRQRAVMQGDFDVFLAHAGQLDDGDDIVRVLIEVESGSPAAEKLRLAAENWPHGQIEEAVHLVPKIGPAIKRRPCGYFRRLITN